MPRLKHSISAELPPAESIDFAQLARDYAAGACDLIVVLGPTASGKTRYAVALAQRSAPPWPWACSRAAPPG